jgi:ATP phosphoribosyltransferase regulatory subunit
LEILRLVLLTLERAGIGNAYLDLGHVGIYRGLARQAGLTPEREMSLFEALQRKAIPELEALVRDWGVLGPAADMLLALAELNGDDALERASRELARADAPVRAALDHLARLRAGLNTWLPAVPVHFDLAELRGYHYKTGVVFAAFVPGWGLEIARGGRYDDIGSVFGRARPAVGFSTDLKGLLRQGRELDARYERRGGLYAPWSPDPALRAEIERLRAAGERVVNELPGQPGGAREAGCAEALVFEGGRWERRPV